MKTPVWVVVWTKVLASLSKSEGTHLTPCIFRTGFIFWEATKLSSKAAVPFCILAGSDQAFLHLRVLTRAQCCQCPGSGPFCWACAGILMFRFALLWWHMTCGIFSTPVCRVHVLYQVSRKPFGPAFIWVERQNYEREREKQRDFLSCGSLPKWIHQLGPGQGEARR